MKPNSNAGPDRPGPTPPVTIASELSTLTGALYEQAPEKDKSKVIEHLLKPLGVMAAAVVANGVFARMVLHRSAPGRGLTVDDIKGIKAQDIVDLAARVQHAGLETFAQLTQWISSSQTLATTAAAAALIALLAREAHSRDVGFEPDLDPPPN